MVVCEWLESMGAAETLFNDLQAEDNYHIPNCIASCIQQVFYLLKPMVT
jgi:hypothetical protein